MQNTVICNRWSNVTFPGIAAARSAKRKYPSELGEKHEGLGEREAQSCGLTDRWETRN